MHKKLKCIALVSMILLVSLGFFSSTTVAPPAPPNPTLGVVEYDYYVVAGYGMTPTLPAPAPQPANLTFTCTASNNPVATGYDFGSLSLLGGRDYMYEGCAEAAPCSDSNAWVQLDITNNLGYTITIADLTAEVTSGTTMHNDTDKGWWFDLGGVFMGNMSLVAVDTLDPWDHTAPVPPQPWDEVDYNLGTVQVHRDLHGIARGYPDWYRYATGIQGHPYPATQLGPATLLENDPLGDALATGHVATKYGGSPITLANGATFTEYFGITIFGLVDPGDQIDATITLRLKYTPPRPMKLHAIEPEELLDLQYPISTVWHELYPRYCNTYHLESWHDDNLDGILSPGDEIDLSDGTWWYVKWVGVTIHLTWLDGDPLEQEMYVESEIEWLEPTPIPDPAMTLWHEAWPTWCDWWAVIGWINQGLPGLDVSDQIIIQNLRTGGIATYHVSAMSTDLELYPEVADVHIVNAVTIFPGFVLLDTMVAFPEWNLPINVTVKNMGTLPLACSVSGYYSLDNSSYLSMGPDQPVYLYPCNGTRLVFYWNLKTSPVDRSIYFMKFTVTGSYLGPLENKNISAYDEFFVKVKSRVMGDVDGDNDCDVGDQRKVQLAMFQNSPNPVYLQWNSFPTFTDMDGDRDVDVGDQRKQQIWMFRNWTSPAP